MSASVDSMTCQTCPFFYILNNECRRNPPIGVAIGPQQSMGFWPPARPEQWCGEHPIRKAQVETRKGFITHGSDR